MLQVHLGSWGEAVEHGGKGVDGNLCSDTEKKPGQGEDVSLLLASWEIKGTRAVVSGLSENQDQAAS